MRRVLITGGNKGIGFATTKLFLQNNYEVTIVARTFDNLPKDIKQKTKQIHFNLENVQEIPQIAKNIGDIDILINNAGLMNTLPYDNYPEEKKQQLLKINLEAPVAFITEFSKGMIKNGNGRVVSVASIAGEIGHPDIWYGVSKAGVINFTKSFAKLLGPQGIVINCIAPGPVNTDMLKIIPQDRVQNLKNSSVLQRAAEPEEIAKTIYWLATESPEYINGICIDVNNTAYLR